MKVFQTALVTLLAAAQVQAKVNDFGSSGGPVKKSFAFEESRQSAKADRCESRGPGRECKVDLHDFKIRDDPDRVELDIFQGGARVNCRKAISKSNVNYWYGTCGGSNDLTVAWHGDRIHATYTGNDEVCIIHPKHGTDSMDCIPKTDEELPEETDAILEPDDEPKARNLRPNTDRRLNGPTVIDLMVVWTTEAECEESGLPKTCTPDSNTDLAMRALVDAAVAQANVAFAVSGIDGEFRLVHAYRDPDYVEASSNKYNVALYDMRDANDGELESVHVERARYKADIVSLLVSKGQGSCGVAFVGPGTGVDNVEKMYSVVNRNCATSTYSFTHELGHTMGTYHDRYSMGGSHCTSSGYNYGWQDRTTAIRSVMSGVCVSQSCDGAETGTCDRVLMFSTPDYLYNGVNVIGDIGHDNAKTISDNIALVAGRYAGWNCQADSDCDDLDSSTTGSCNLSNNVCVFTQSSSGPVSIAWNANSVSSTVSSIRSEFALDSTAPTRVADENYDGPDVYGALDKATQGSWNMGTYGASGLRVRFDQTHSGQSTAGLFLLKADSPLTFTSSENTLSAVQIHCNMIERLSSATIRFVIEEGGQYYISEASSNLAAGSGSWTSSFALQALSASWFSYDPTSSADAVSLIGGSATPQFTGVGFVGFTIFATAATVSDTRVNFGVRELLITATLGGSSVDPDVNIAWDAAVDVVSSGSSVYGETALNTNTPMMVADGTNYLGVDIYGAFEKESKGSWNVANNGGSGLRIRFNAADKLHSCTGLFLIQPDSEIYFTTERDTISADEIFTSKMQNLDSASIRFVIGEQGQFYISEPSEDFTGGSGYTTDSFSLEAMSATWFSYDPISSASSVSVIGSAASPSFENIGFVGFALFAASADVANASVNFGVRELTIIAKESPAVRR